MIFMNGDEMKVAIEEGIKIFHLVDKNKTKTNFLKFEKLKFLEV